jgi:hypothetical protein
MTQTDQEKTQISQQWLRDHCPEGIRTADGGLLQADVDKIQAYIDKAYDGVVSVQSLNAAVLQLGTQLTWLDSSPEAVRLRGMDKPRVLTEEMQYEAGLKRRPDARVNHAETEAITNEDIQKNIKRMAKDIIEKLGIQNPFQAMAEALTMEDRQGRIDHQLTGELHQVFAHRNGKVDWEKTYELRQIACDNHRARKNQQRRPGGKIQ